MNKLLERIQRALAQPGTKYDKLPSIIYRDILVASDPVDGAFIVKTERIYDEPVTTATATMLLLEPHQGDLLVYDGSAWKVARRDGQYFYNEAHIPEQMKEPETPPSFHVDPLPTPPPIGEDDMPF